MEKKGDNRFERRMIKETIVPKGTIVLVKEK